MRPAVTMLISTAVLAQPDALDSTSLLQLVKSNPRSQDNGTPVGIGVGTNCGGPVCKIFCEHGNVLDDTGCPTCVCKKEPECGQLDCGQRTGVWNEKLCEHGKVLDDNGCPTCECKMLKTCENGSVCKLSLNSDKLGCPVPACAKPPQGCTWYQQPPSSDVGSCTMGKCCAPTSCGVLACESPIFGKCPKECPKDPECSKENEELKDCGACDSECGEKATVCTMDCQAPACGCKVDKADFVRDYNGECVPREECTYNCLTKEVWSDEKTAWCCENTNEGRGCPEVYNCLTRELWSAEKTAWCCKNESRGCPKECSKENEELKDCGACDSECGEKARVCTMDCQVGTPACGCKADLVRDRGECVLREHCSTCPAMDEPRCQDGSTPGVIGSTTDKNGCKFPKYAACPDPCATVKCEACDESTCNGLCEKKEGQCCETCSVNCDTCESGSYNDGCNDCTCGGFAVCTKRACLTQGTPKCNPDPFDCNTKEEWSDEKKAWCCKNKRLGCCEEECAAECNSDSCDGVCEKEEGACCATCTPYNCKTKEVWSDEKKTWDAAKDEWSKKKTAYTEDVWSTDPTKEVWSKEKKAWCCENKGLGCPKDEGKEWCRKCGHSYFDGCNTCRCGVDGTPSCTEKFCPKKQEPRCCEEGEVSAESPRCEPQICENGKWKTGPQCVGEAENPVCTHGGRTFKNKCEAKCNKARVCHGLKVVCAVTRTAPRTVKKFNNKCEAQCEDVEVLKDEKRSKCRRLVRRNKLKCKRKKHADSCAGTCCSQ